MNNNNYNKYKLTLNHENLKKVKLILGNGFDLACKLESSYKDFFDYNKDINAEIEKWIKEGNSLLNDNISCWDVFFYLISLINKDNKYEIVNWMDVEANIKYGLGFSDSNNNSLDFNFKIIEDKIINKESNIKLKDNNEILYESIRCKDNINNKKEYYGYLMKELEKFEERFSNYLKRRIECSGYNKNVKRMFSDGFLDFGPNTIASIDTFNYTTPEYFTEKYNPLFVDNKPCLRHINGKIDSAIFGIDSNEIDLNDERYIFTKTYRKLKVLVDGGRDDFKREFYNVVVYGHSLSEADYSYFFSVLDKLDLYNYGSYQNRLIIVYNVFDKNKETKIKENIINSVTKLLDAYDKWKNPNSSRYRLIESAIASDRIGFIEIGNLD